MDNNILLDFGEPEREKSIIKVIGVGGGGGNAVKAVAVMLSTTCIARASTT